VSALATALARRRWRSRRAAAARERCGEGNEKWAGELVWQARGVLKTRPAALGSLWRVARASRRPATRGIHAAVFL